MHSVRNAVKGTFIVSVQVRVCDASVLPQISHSVNVANENIVDPDPFYFTSDLNTANFFPIEPFYVWHVSIMKAVIPETVMVSC